MQDRLAGLLAMVAALVTISAQAGTFDCRDVAPTAPGHQHVFLFLTEQVGIRPVEFGYCEHDSSPRWVARWAPFEDVEHDGEIWRRYATARCWDDNGGFNCHITNHVVAGASHVVVDIEQCDISISEIAAVHGAVAQYYPGYEMKAIEFAVVRDGGVWSPSEYGYVVRLIEPPEFDGGPIRHFVQRCEDGRCSWHDKGSEGSWFGGSTHLPNLRRTRHDPLIEYIEP